MMIYAVVRELTKTVYEATAILPAGGGREYYKTTLENVLEKMVDSNEQNSQVNHGMSDPGERKVKAFYFV